MNLFEIVVDSLWGRMKAEQGHHLAVTLKALQSIRKEIHKMIFNDSSNFKSEHKFLLKKWKRLPSVTPGGDMSSAY